MTDQAQEALNGLAVQADLYLEALKRGVPVPILKGLLDPFERTLVNARSALQDAPPNATVQNPDAGLTSDHRLFLDTPALPETLFVPDDIRALTASTPQEISDIEAEQLDIHSIHEIAGLGDLVASVTTRADVDELVSTDVSDEEWKRARAVVRTNSIILARFVAALIETARKE